MRSLDHHKLLANDRSATMAFLDVIEAALRRYLKDRSRVREVSQSALAELIAKLRAGLEPKHKKMHAWVINCATNALRRELTRLRRQAVTYESRLHAQPGTDPGELLDARRQVERIEALLEAWNSRDRLALEAKARGDSDQEIATELGISTAAVRCSVSRTRQRLRLSLTPEQKRQRLLMLVRLAAQGQGSPFRPMQESSR